MPCAKGREKQGQGKARLLTMVGKGHLVPVGWEELLWPYWPERGWKLLRSPTACSCLNPFGWLCYSVILEVSVNQMSVKPGIFH